MNRLIDADALLDKWNNLSEKGRKEFDQVIMCEPTFKVENNLKVYTVQNTTGDPNAINVFQFQIDENGDTQLSLHEYVQFYENAIKKLPERVTSCLLPSCMSADVWTKEELINWANLILENIQ